MSDAREFWGRLLAGGSLSPEEESELLRTLEADESLRTEFIADAQLDGLLRTVDRAEQDAGDFKRGVLQCLSAHQDGGRFIARVQSRLKEAKAETPRALRRVRIRRSSNAGPVWGAALAAAAILIVVLAVVLTPGKPAAPPREPVVKQPQPEPEAPPAPEVVHVRPEPNPIAPPPRPGTPARSPRERIRPANAPPPAAPPAPPPPRPETPEPGKTESRPAPSAVAAIVLEGVEGTVRIEKADAKPGTPIREGGTITTGAGSTAVLRFADGTRVELGPETEVRDVRSAVAKEVFVAAGTVRADVARQPLLKPMEFATPYGKATVLGTKFTLDVRAEGYAHLRVREGRVRLTRAKDRKSVVVTEGHFATAGEGIDLRAARFPIEDIVLRPDQARLAGAHWAPVRDPEASSGMALEGRKTSYTTSITTRYALSSPRTSFVTFSFDAEAGKDYSVWIRGRTMAKTRRNYFDEVVIVPENADVSLTDPSIQDTDPRGALYKGFSRTPGYGWVGGYGEGNRDTVPVSIRFHRSGRQVLKVYCVEPVVRVDAIWLSTAQKTRPADTEPGPARR